MSGTLIHRPGEYRWRSQGSPGSTTTTRLETRCLSRLHRRGPRGARGSSLMEVLVALLIMSAGLLGMVALQARTLRASVEAVQRMQAVMLAQQLLDLMRVDRRAASLGAYDTGSTPSCDPAQFGGATLAQLHLRTWLGTVKSQIGQAADTTTCIRAGCNGSDLCQVEIRWVDSVSTITRPQVQTFSARL